MGGVTLPSGTLTFLLSDVEGSTRLWEVEREAMAVALPRSLQLVEDVASSYGGVLPVEQGEGDSRLAVFPRAADALTAAVAIQRAMAEQPWPDGAALRVRIAVHAGDARLRDERTYGGGVVHRAARLRALARGGQVLVSRAVHDLVADELPVGMELVDLGRHRLRDLSRPEEVFELRHPDLAVVEGGLRSLAAVPNTCPRRCRASSDGPTSGPNSAGFLRSTALSRSRVQAGAEDAAHPRGGRRRRRRTAGRDLAGRAFRCRRRGARGGHHPRLRRRR